MKTTLQIDLTAIFGTPECAEGTCINPPITMVHGDCQQYHSALGQACLQQFDGLLGYIHIMDLCIPSDIVIPLSVQHPDLHIFYVMTEDFGIQLHDVHQQINYPIVRNRGRYFYLASGDYALHIPAGRYTIVNFYFRGSIFRAGNERPFQFLHPLIAAYRRKDPATCCSVDFRVGARTIQLMKTIMSNIKKGDLDSEVKILWGIRKLIQLSKEKIFEEYGKISQSQLRSKEAYACIRQAVAEHGHDFRLQDIAMQLGISLDYLHAIIHSYYGQSPNELKIKFMLDLAKKYILDGMHTNEIAYELGYTSPCSFTRFFKQQTGMTATEFFTLNNQ